MTFVLLLLILGQLQFSSGHQGDSQQAERSSQSFKPARYKSIRFGVSKAADLIKAFGKPLYDTGNTIRGRFIGYEDIWLVPGKVEFWVDPKTGIVYSMSIFPLKMNTPDVAALLGPGSTFSSWTFTACDDEGQDFDGRLVYRHPDGGFRTMDFPHLGITVTLASGYALRVREVVYSTTPYGLDEDPCLTQKKRKQGSNRRK